MILEYWGTEVNTQFDVVFEYSKDKFTLRGAISMYSYFGIVNDLLKEFPEISKNYAEE